MQQSQRTLGLGLMRIWVQPRHKYCKNPKPFYRCMSNQFEEVEIPIPGGHIAGKWWNKNKSDPVLAIHGWLGNASTFDRLIPLLSPEISILAIDLPGFGLSPPLPAGCYYHRFGSVVTLRKIASYFKWDKFSLLGHAMGGSIAFLYSCLYPETIKSLSIVNAPMTPIPINEDKYVEVAGSLIDKFLERDQNEAKAQGRAVFSREEAAEFTSILYDNKISQETVDHLLQRSLRCNENDQCNIIHDRRLKDSRLSGWNHDDIVKMAEVLKTHVLLIKYDESPFYMPQEEFFKSWVVIKANALSASIHILKGQRHDIIENPHTASDILNQHLKKYHLVSTEKH